MGHLWPWPTWQSVLPAAQASGSTKEEERQTQAQTWQSISLAQIVWILEDDSLGHCRILCLFLATDSLFYGSKKLFHSLSSCWKLLAQTTTSPLLLCFPTTLTGRHIPFPPQMFPVWIPLDSVCFTGIQDNFLHPRLFYLFFSWMILHNISNDIFIAVFSWSSKICQGRCFTNNIITLKI